MEWLKDANPWVIAAWVIVVIIGAGGGVKVIQALTAAFQARHASKLAEKAADRKAEMDDRTFVQRQADDLRDRLIVEVTELRKEIITTHHEYQDIRDQLAEALANLKISRMEGTVLRKEVQKGKNEIAAQNQEIARLRTENEEQSREMSGLKDENEQLRRSLQSLEQKVEIIQRNGNGTRHYEDDDDEGGKGGR